MFSALETGRRLFDAIFVSRDEKAALACFSEGAMWLDADAGNLYQGREGVEGRLSRCAARVREGVSVELMDLTEAALAPEASLLRARIRVDRADELRADVVCVPGESGPLAAMITFYPAGPGSVCARSCEMSRLINGVPVGLGIFRCEGESIRAEYLSDHFTAMSGWNREQYAVLTAQDPLALVDEAHKPELMGKIRALIKSGDSMQARYRRRTSRDMIWVQMTVNVFQRDDAGIWVNAALIDVTREVSAELEMYSLVSSSPGGLAIFEEKDGRIECEYASDNLKRLTGNSEELAGIITSEKVYDVVHPDDLAKVRENFEALTAGRREAKLSYRLRLESGAYQWIDLLIWQYGAEGNTRRMCAVFTNGEEKMRAINGEKAARQELDNVISNLPIGVGIFRCGPDEISALYFSRRCAEIFGMTSEAFSASIAMDQPLGARIAKGVNDCFLRSEAAADGRFAMEYRRSDGARINVRVLFHRVRGGGAPLLYLSMEDVTEVTERGQKDRWQGELYRILCEGSDAATFDYDPERDVMTCCINRRGKPKIDRVLEGFIREINGCNYIGAEFRQSCAARMRVAVERPGDGALDFMGSFLAQEYSWKRAFYVSLADDQGRVYRVVGRIDDIQEEKEREEALKAAINRENRYRRSLISGAVMALEYDMETGERCASEMDVLPEFLPPDTGLRQLFAMLRQFAVHRDDVAKVFGSRTLDRIREEIEENGGSMNFVCRMRLENFPDGEYRWMQTTLTSAEDQSSHHLHLFLRTADIHDAKLRELRLQAEATQDPLTGLSNRTAFEKNCRERIAAEGDANRSARSWVYVLIDIDGFRRVNDAYGHLYGDAVLSRVASTLRAFAQDGDALCRMGADVFAVFIDRQQGNVLLDERLRILASALQYPLDEGERLHVSIGVSAYPQDGATMAELYDCADQALMYAKKLGGDRLVPYEAKLRRLVRGQEKSAVWSASPEDGRRVFLRTFGHFDVFVDGKAVLFNLAKAKELLALLVDRRGGFVTSAEAISCLWEDEEANKLTLARCRKTAMRLKLILEENGIADIMETVSGKRRIVPEMVDCDLFRYVSGNRDDAHLFNGSYLSDYSWAENTLAELDARAAGFQQI